MIYACLSSILQYHTCVLPNSRPGLPRYHQSHLLALALALVRRDASTASFGSMLAY